MRKFNTPLIIVQFVLMIMFLMYALVQRTEAMEQHEIARQAEMIAQENEQRAIVAQKLAEQAQDEAKLQAELARQARDACEKRKK
jgi:septal ring factor EnvC (AmiA/AmiB activator)